MDGLILDTERLNYQAYIRAAKKFGFQLTSNFYMSQCGKNEQAVIQGLCDGYGDEHDVLTWRAYIREQKDVIRAERQGKVGKKKGLLELLNYLQERGIPYALASSSDLDLIHRCLEGEYLLHAFTRIVDGQHVERSKPDPEIFLKACALCEAEPAHTLVLEDSLAGITAANAGGFTSGYIFDDLTDLPPVTEGLPVHCDFEGPDAIRRIADISFDDLSCVIDYLERA